METWRILPIQIIYYAVPISYCLPSYQYTCTQPLSNDTKLTAIILVINCCISYYWTDSSALSCNCNGNRRCDDKDQCTLQSTKHSCYTILRRLGSVIVYERGCVKNCMEYHNEDEIRMCCYGDMCNDGAIPTTWPPASSAAVSTVTPTKIYYTPPSLNEGTPPTPAPPTATPDVSIFEQPTTSDPQRPTHLICHCSGCRDGGKTCLAAVACASHVVETINMTWCIQDEFSCKNDTFQLNCCYDDYCNGPSKPNQEPPCDDEDMEASGSGGCDSGKQLISKQFSSSYFTYTRC